MVAVQSLLGTAELVQREENTVDELVIQACNQEKFAINAVKSLQDNSFSKIISDAVDACFTQVVGHK